MRDKLKRKLAKPEKLRIALVEDNPYDRALIDVLFEQDDRIQLEYTAHADGTFGLLDAQMLRDRLPVEDQPFDVVLLDLALDGVSKETLSSPHFAKHFQDAEARRFGYQVLSFPPDQRADLLRLTLRLFQSQHGTPTGDDLTRLELADGLNQLLGTDKDALKLIDKLRDSPHGNVTALDDATIDRALDLLWTSSQSLRDFLRSVARAPSLWLHLLLILENRGTCFCFVSHYVNDETRPALEEILAIRNPVDPLSHKHVYAPLVISKADLDELPERLRGARETWLKMGSVRSLLGPYAYIPVVMEQESGRCIPMEELVEELSAANLDRGHRWELGPHSCTILWDEPGWLFGPETGQMQSARLVSLWRTVLARWLASIRVTHGQVSMLDHGMDHFVIQDFPVTAREAEAFVLELREALERIGPRHGKSGHFLYLHVRGPAEAAEIVKNSVSGCAKLHRLPNTATSLPARWSLRYPQRTPTWDRALKDIVKNIPVGPKGVCLPGADADRGSGGSVVTLEKWLGNAGVQRASVADAVLELADALMNDDTGERWRILQRNLTDALTEIESSPGRCLQVLQERQLVLHYGNS